VLDQDEQCLKSFRFERHHLRLAPEQAPDRVKAEGTELKKARLGAIHSRGQEEPERFRRGQRLATSP
jgi:hypothetical protein